MVHKIGAFGAHNIATKPPSFARPPAITIEYVDLESSIKLSALRERAQRNQFERSAQSQMQSALSEHLKRHEIPSLMERTKARLNKQVEELKNTLVNRYDATNPPKVNDDSPQARGKRLAGVAIAMFDSFLKAQKQPSDVKGSGSKRSEFAELMRQAMDKGCEEASGLYGGLEMLDPKLAQDVKETFAEARRRLDSFVADRDPKSPSDGDA